MSDTVTKEEGVAAIADLAERLLEHWAELSLQPNSPINLIEFLHESDDGDVLTINDLDPAPAEMEDSRPEVQDPLLEINVGTEADPRPLFISKLLSPELSTEMIGLLNSYKDCFAWEYHEMPGLPRDLVEHELRIKDGFRPFQQPPRRFSAEVQLKVKEEIERLLKAGFIRTARYVEWLANIVPVLKKTGALRVCTDYRNLNLATPKDEYPMPMADLLVDGAAKHELLSFMDGHAGYNQIFIAESDVHKTAFRCPGAIGTYEWVVMPFGLKNAGATYQRAMNLIFHDLIGRTVEVYIDDVVVKSASKADHLGHLRQAFERMRKHGLKMNPKKCAFGVTAGNFLGFLIHQRGIEIDKNKAKAIMAAPPPTSKKELQSFLGKVNFLRRFISNLAGKIRPLSPLLKLRDQDEFVWTAEHQKAFDEVKMYLTQPPVLMPPKRGKPLKLYISASDNSIGCLLAQNNESEKEQAIYYLSRTLNVAELNYSPIEKLCLALYFAATKLRHYMLPSVVQIISKTDLIKYMLTRPIIRGRIGKWTMALSEFTFQYVAQKSVKGQALADFLAHHPTQGALEEAEVEIGMIHMEKNFWTMYFDGSSTEATSGAGIVIESPQGQKWQFAFQLDFRCTNNQAEYEALIIGLEILKGMKATRVLVYGDSQLVINQLTGEYQCISENLTTYYVTALNSADGFSRISFEHVPRVDNHEANEMAQIASGVNIPEGEYSRVIKIERRTLPTLAERGMPTAIMSADLVDTAEEDWRYPIVSYLRHPSGDHEKSTRFRARWYLIYQNELYRKGSDGLLLLCLGTNDARTVMGDSHEGICGAHQSGIKMRWLIRRHGYYWPTILKDCIEYAKGCIKCQIYGPIQRVPAEALHPITKPWPFRSWAVDIIGKIHPPSSNQHAWILVATDYFTKWVEAKSYRSISSAQVVQFFEHHIVHRFGIPETIMADNGPVFISAETQEYAEKLGIKLIHSTPYYPQSNGQAEASNKVIKGILEKMIEERPRAWHDLLAEALWAYRTSKRSATGTSPYALTYGHDAILPMEMTIRSLRVIEQHSLNKKDYKQAMCQELEDLEQIRIDAYNLMQAQKRIAARAYNKHVKQKTFVEGSLVWRAVLPIGTKDPRFGKFSPTWEGPFIIDKILGLGAYQLRDKDGEQHSMPINGQYLKRYIPSIWETAEKHS